MSGERTDGGRGDDETWVWTPRFKLPVEAKTRLEALCTLEGMAKRDDARAQVLTGLGFGDRGPRSRGDGSGRFRAEPARFDEVRECTYGCGFMSTSKSGLTQHEDSCENQGFRRVLERAEVADKKRRVAEAKLI